MSTLSLENSRESAAPTKGSAKSSAPRRRKVTSTTVVAKNPPRFVVSKSEKGAAAKMPPKAQEPGGERVTKRERMLTLLSRPEGASIQEMMHATGWQQHSVRGFLAGTLKRKLGFSLTSFKPDDGVRRYRIEPRRSR